MATSNKNKGPAQRPAAKKPAAKNAGRPTSIVTWGLVAAVLLAVVVIVVIKVTGGSSSQSDTSFTPISSTLASELANVPTSVFNTVGVTSSAVTVTPPAHFPNEPLLTGTTTDGKKLPMLFYFGSEYCPYCAAQRWPIAIALSRFGTFHNLGNMTSSSVDTPASVPTITFTKATYTSPYVVFHSIEQYTNVYNASTNPPYALLQKPTTFELAQMTKYDSMKYFSWMNQQNQGSIPFMAIGDRFLSAGASYGPEATQGQSRDSIGAGLSDPTNPLTQAIIASANYITAGICNTTGQQPAAVCNSAGVQAAKASLKI